MAVSKVLEDAVNSNDVSRVYSAFYTIMLSDPGFSTDKFDKAMDYVQNKNMRTFIMPHDGEVFEREEKWTQEYWDIQASKLMDNFSKERIEHLKDVGRKLHPTIKVDTRNDVNMHEQKVHSNTQKKTNPIELSIYQKDSPKTGMILLGVGILIVVILLIVVLM